MLLLVSNLRHAEASGWNHLDRRSTTCFKHKVTAGLAGMPFEVEAEHVPETLAEMS
jgi:hypothetical protein